MNDLELPWLIPTFLQIVGLAIGLGVIGFGYERAALKRSSLVGEIERGRSIIFLAVGGAFFALGTCFTQATWLIKAFAVLIALLLILLSFTRPEKQGA